MRGEGVCGTQASSRCECLSSFSQSVGITFISFANITEPIVPNPSLDSTLFSQFFSDRVLKPVTQAPSSTGFHATLLLIMFSGDPSAWGVGSSISRTPADPLLECCSITSHPLGKALFSTCPLFPKRQTFPSTVKVHIITRPREEAIVPTYLQAKVSSKTLLTIPGAASFLKFSSKTTFF